jgi:hypothetical protein
MISARKRTFRCTGRYYRRIEWRRPRGCRDGPGFTGILRLCDEVDGLVATGEVAEHSDIGKGAPRRMLSHCGVKLHVGRRGPPVWQIEALVAAARREVPSETVDEGQDAGAVHGVGPIFGHPWGQRTLRQARGRRATGPEASRRVRAFQSNLSRMQAPRRGCR